MKKEDSSEEENMKKVLHYFHGTCELPQELHVVDYTYQHCTRSCDSRTTSRMRSCRTTSLVEHHHHYHFNLKGRKMTSRERTRTSRKRKTGTRIMASRRGRVFLMSLSDVVAFFLLGTTSNIRGTEGFERDLLKRKEREGEDDEERTNILVEQLSVANFPDGDEDASSASSARTSSSSLSGEVVQESSTSSSSKRRAGQQQSPFLRKQWSSNNNIHTGEGNKSRLKLRGTRNIRQEMKGTMTPAQYELQEQVDHDAGHLWTNRTKKRSFRGSISTDSYIAEREQKQAGDEQWAEQQAQAPDADVEMAQEQIATGSDAGGASSSGPISQFLMQLFYGRGHPANKTEGSTTYGGQQHRNLSPSVVGKEGGEIEAGRVLGGQIRQSKFRGSASLFDSRSSTSKSSSTTSTTSTTTIPIAATTTTTVLRNTTATSFRTN
ncbi:unnamed protein product, partial [Amoebophrya sp. A25]|eukprot:GSA25T00007153001.1